MQCHFALFLIAWQISVLELRVIVLQISHYLFFFAFYNLSLYVLFAHVAPVENFALQPNYFFPAQCRTGLILSFEEAK